MENAQEALAFEEWSTFEREARGNYASSLRILTRDFDTLEPTLRRRLGINTQAVRVFNEQVTKCLAERDASDFILPPPGPADSRELEHYDLLHGRVRDARVALRNGLKRLIRVYERNQAVLRRNSTLYAREVLGLVESLIAKDDTNLASLEWQERVLGFTEDILITAQGRKPPPDPAHDHRPWLGGWFLGQGGQGSVAVWVMQDAAVQLCDRIAVKEQDITPDWNHADFWHDVNAKDEPVEITCLRLLSDEPSILKLRAHVIYSGHEITAENDNEANTHPRDPDLRGNTPSEYEGLPVDREHRMRMFMEVCPHGDLHDLLRRQFRGDYQPTQKGYYGVFPEPFLWHVFDQLAAGVMAMDRVQLDERRQMVLHLDFKPANIFLDNHLPTRFPAYPSVKIGDFGFARITYRGDLRNPGRFVGYGTPGWRAPEQCQLPVEHYPRFDWAGIGMDRAPGYMSSKTNLWSIANIIFCLMENIIHGNDVEVSYFQPNNGHHPGFSWKGKRYSRTLRKLVMRCLHRHPRQRPPVGQVRRNIQRRIADDNVASGMQSLPRRDPAARQYRLKSGFQPDKWVIGARWNQKYPPDAWMLIPSPEEALDVSQLNPPGDDSDDDRPDTPIDLAEQRDRDQEFHPDERLDDDVGSPLSGTSDDTDTSEDYRQHQLATVENIPQDRREAIDAACRARGIAPLDWDAVELDHARIAADWPEDEEEDDDEIEQEDGQQDEGQQDDDQQDDDQQDDDQQDDDQQDDDQQDDDQQDEDQEEDEEAKPNRRADQYPAHVPDPMNLGGGQGNTTFAPSQ